MNLNNAGIYIHIPFCRSKCPYCDFYSLRLDEDSADAYTDALLRRIPALASRYGVSADTIYLGGGTPRYFSGGEAFFDGEITMSGVCCVVTETEGYDYQGDIYFIP